MSNNLKGNRAVKIPSDVLSYREQMALFSRDGYIYWNMVNFCQSFIEELAITKNIDILEYNTLLNQKCHKYEKLFFGALRQKMREKMRNDQIREFADNYNGIFHPYNPYLQKYNGEYLRTYQQFY